MYYIELWVETTRQSVQRKEALLVGLFYYLYDIDVLTLDNSRFD
jgi:hypothetical protein